MGGNALLQAKRSRPTELRLLLVDSSGQGSSQSALNLPFSPPAKTATLCSIPISCNLGKLGWLQTHCAGHHRFISMQNTWLARPQMLTTPHQELLLSLLPNIGPSLICFERKKYRLCPLLHFCGYCQLLS